MTSLSLSLSLSISPSPVAAGRSAVGLADLLPERGAGQRGDEAEPDGDVRGDPRERDGDGRALLLGAAPPILHHAHLLPGAHQPLPGHAGQEEAGAGHGEGTHTIT